MLIWDRLLLGTVEYIDDNGLKVINIPPALNYCEILVDLKKI